MLAGDFTHVLCRPCYRKAQDGSDSLLTTRLAFPLSCGRPYTLYVVEKGVFVPINRRTCSAYDASHEHTLFLNHSLLCKGGTRCFAPSFWKPTKSMLLSFQHACVGTVWVVLPSRAAEFRQVYLLFVHVVSLCQAIPESCQNDCCCSTK